MNLCRNCGRVAKKSEMVARVNGGMWCLECLKASIRPTRSPNDRMVKPLVLKKR